MTANDIRKVMTLGSGTMAQQIATQCALFGRSVVIYARNEKERQVAIRGIPHVVLAPIAKAGMISDNLAAEALGRISYIMDPRDTPEDVDLVSESVFERYDTKEEVWARFAPHLPKHAILTTNTSSLQPSRFAKACGAPERFLAWHFYTPIFFQNTVDVMPLPETDPELVTTMIDFSHSIHENPVLITKETPGFLANNLLFSVLNTAMDLYRQGAAPFEEIDRSWMGVRLANAGPFGLIDKIGLDTTYDILSKWYGTNPENLPILADKISKGELGVKSGKGFYTYPGPAFQAPDFVVRARPVEE